MAENTSASGKSVGQHASGRAARVALMSVIALVGSLRAATALDPCGCDGYRPPPGFGRVRFFNGTGTTKPAAVRVQPGSAGTPTDVVVPDPGATTTRAMNGPTHVDQMTVSVHLLSGDTAAELVLNHHFASDERVLEVHVLLVDAAQQSRVELSGRALVLKQQRFAWVVLDSTKQSPVLGALQVAASSSVEPLRDVSLLNNSSTELTYTLAYRLRGYAGTISSGTLTTGPGLSGGDWGSSAAVDGTELDLVSLPPSPDSGVMSQSGSVCISYFFVESTPSGQLSIIASWVERHAAPPYWEFH